MKVLLIKSGSVCLTTQRKGISECQLDKNAHKCLKKTLKSLKVFESFYSLEGIKKFYIGSIKASMMSIYERKSKGKEGLLSSAFYFSSSIAFSTIANTSSTGSSEFIWKRREKSLTGLKREQCESYFSQYFESLSPS